MKIEHKQISADIQQIGKLTLKIWSKYLQSIEPVNFESLEVAEHLVSESAEIFVDSLVEC